MYVRTCAIGVYGHCDRSRFDVCCIFQGHIEDIMSAEIPYDCDEPCMRLVLQEQLQTGRVFVNRFGPNQQLGYRWLVTFMGQPEGADLPLFVVSVAYFVCYIPWGT